MRDKSPTVSATGTRLHEVRYRLEAAGPPRQLPLQLTASGDVWVDTTVAHLDDHGDVWRILNVHGSAGGIAQALRVFEDYKPSFLREKEVLGASERRLILWYKYRAPATSQTALAFRLLGRDTVVTDSTRGSAITVRVLARAGAALGRFLKVARASAAPDTFTLLYSGPPQADEPAGLTAAELQTLRVAWQMGYYATPRTIGVRDVAGREGLSASAAGYRLRRAEAKLVQKALEA